MSAFPSAANASSSNACENVPVFTPAPSDNEGSLSRIVVASVKVTPPFAAGTLPEVFTESHRPPSVTTVTLAANSDVLLAASVAVADTTSPSATAELSVTV